MTHDARYYNANLSIGAVPRRSRRRRRGEPGRCTAEQARRAVEQLTAFTATPLDEVLDRHLREDPREAAVCALPRGDRAGARLPLQFLAEHGVDPAQVRHLRRLPAGAPGHPRRGYVQKHPLASSSAAAGGSRRATWYACVRVDRGAHVLAALLSADLSWPSRRALRARSSADGFCGPRERSTLAVVCFALGTWVGGMFTCARAAATWRPRATPVTVITPGNNREEILRVAAELGPSFDQVVLLGYPPFVKDVVDAGLARGVDWGRLGTRVVTAGEVSSAGVAAALMAERIEIDVAGYDFPRRGVAWRHRRRGRARQRDAALHRHPPLPRRPARGGARGLRRRLAPHAGAVRPAEPLLRGGGR